MSLLRPANEVWGKLIFSEACVKNSVHRGVSVHARIQHPPWGHTSLTRHPPDQAHALDQASSRPGTHPLDQALPRPGTSGPGTPWTRHPKDQALPRPGTHLDQAPPDAEHAGRYGQQVDGMHPTGMQSCCQLCFGCAI